MTIQYAESDGRARDTALPNGWEARGLKQRLYGSLRLAARRVMSAPGAHTAVGDGAPAPSGARGHSEPRPAVGACGDGEALGGEEGLLDGLAP